MKTSLLASSALSHALKYLRDDINRSYSLLAPAWAEYEGKGIGIGDFTDDPWFSIRSVKGGGAVRLESKIFDASAKIWNGPDLIPDNLDDGSMEESLWHDHIHRCAPRISKSTGLSEAEVIAWGNGLYYAGTRARTRRAKLYYWAVEHGRRVWLPLRRLFARLALAAVCAVCFAGCNGCAEPPDWHKTGGSEILYERGE